MRAGGFCLKSDRMAGCTPVTPTTFPKHISDWWCRKTVNSLAILLQFHKSMISVTLEKSLD